ncbi:MAG TPA: hypothetical protein ENK95_01380, partial [Campylobacterales bacterium]|nr:hypothetical protein [Campylobacterales bacterium]
MKTFLTIMIAIIFSACRGDNAYDGETGLIQATAANSDALASLQENVFVAHADAFKASTVTFKE